MFAARLANALCGSLLVIIVLVYFFRQIKVPFLKALLISTAIWATSITSPFALPYWHGFLLSLGELQGVLILALGVSALFSSPLCGIFIFGVCVWHGKFLYALYALGAVIAYILTFRPRYQRILSFAVMFFAPLILFYLYYAIKFDFVTAQEFLSSQLAWMTAMKAGSTQNVFAPELLEKLSRLFSRFNDPSLEWVYYSKGQKLKMLGCAVAPIFLGIGYAGTRWLKFYDIKEKFILRLILVFCGALLIHDVWYFFIHAQMYARHLQPALYVGAGMLIYLSFQITKKFTQLRALWFTCLLLVILTQCLIAWQQPLLRETLTYSRQCKDLYGPSCGGFEIKRIYFSE